MKKIRTLTMYLPQFHRTVENDTWWGEGFTEWTAVKNAVPLFEGHVQPKKPLNNNYYCLLNKEVMIWQAELMKKYGIDGQCFYHYYFKNGRKILEKPAENLLRWKDIDMPFCFCWANGTWSRTWSNIRGNSWGDIFEKDSKDALYMSNGILLEQKYGREKEWKEHLEYLLPFFKDERYIKVNGHPVFMLYLPDDIYCLSQMIDYWNILMEEKDMPKIYYIAMNTDIQIQGIDAILYHAPHAFWNLKKESEYGGVMVADYSEVWTNIVAKSPAKNCKTYFSGVVSCDDTPRRGKNGVYIKNFSSEKFYSGLCNLYKKSLYLENEFVFLNAWNEWGEGMYLEPDEQRGYQYLECIKKAQEQLVDETNISFDFKEEKKEFDLVKAEEQATKNYKLARCLDNWMYARSNNKNIGKYLELLSIETVAIYGYGMLGKHLIEELKESNIKIQYIIEQRSSLKNPLYSIVSPDDLLEEVDAIIVTPVVEFYSIYKKLKEKTNARIFSIEEIILENL